MFSVLVAKWVGDAFGRESIYEELIMLNNYPFLDTKIDIEVSGTASDMISTHRQDLKLVTVCSNTVESLREMVTRFNFTGYPIVTTEQERILVGFILTEKLRLALENIMEVGAQDKSVVSFSKHINPDLDTFDLSEYVEKNPIHVLEETPIDRIYDLFKALGLRFCLVSRLGRIIGIITKKDCLEFIKYLEHEKHDKKKKKKKAQPTDGDGHGSMISSASSTSVALLDDSTSDDLSPHSSNQ